MYTQATPIVDPSLIEANGRDLPDLRLTCCVATRATLTSHTHSALRLDLKLVLKRLEGLVNNLYFLAH